MEHLAIRRFFFGFFFAIFSKSTRANPCLKGGFSRSSGPKQLAFLGQISRFFRKSFGGASRGLYLPPILIEYYPAAAPVAAIFVWITDTGSRALSAAMFCLAIAMVSLLVKDAYKGLFRAPSMSPAGSIALDDGTVVPAGAGSTPDAEVEILQIRTTRLPLTLARKLFLLISSFCAQQFFLNDIVSVERPLLQNIGAAVIYTLREFQVLQLLFGAFMVIMAVTVMKKRRPERAATQTDDAPGSRVDVGDENLVVEEEHSKKALVV
ncbi:hypothetical protein MSAN_00840900 [Mycena sanguinolenta]|uniref:Uncharacterized protein n=1 Tax=Mycena sanguinolenta TaxID=230812 RepID=A0A8H7DD60_9AGAR|nr:hypothetical protein MSAN_00840900 [Mycena sanguinolenta]